MVIEEIKHYRNVVANQEREIASLEFFLDKILTSCCSRCRSHAVAKRVLAGKKMGDECEQLLQLFNTGPSRR